MAAPSGWSSCAATAAFLACANIWGVKLKLVGSSVDMMTVVSPVSE